jgi:tetratricopeptide (TPR) repeat protein
MDFINFCHEELKSGLPSFRTLPLLTENCLLCTFIRFKESLMSINPPGQWWDKLVVALEFADLSDPATCERLDSAAAKAHNQGLHMAISWQYARALPMLTAAVEVWSRIGQMPGEISARNTRGAVYRKIGNYDDAIEDHSTAMQLAREQHISGAEITARAHLGAVYVEQQAFEQAETLLDEALALSIEAADNWGTGHTRRFLGYLHEARKAWDPALNAYGSAVEVWRTLAAPVEEVEATAGVARVMLAQGLAVGAYALAEGVLVHLGQQGPARLDDPLRVYWTIYRVLHGIQQEDSAREMLDLARQMMHKQAEGLDDEQRTRFFADVALHRAIAEA